MQKLIAMNDMPHIVLDAKDIARLPKYSPGELLEPSLAERMAVVESQLQQLNDNASSNAAKRIMYEQKVDSLEKRDKKPLADNQDNRAPCGSVCSTVRSTQAWRNVPLTVRLPSDSKSHITHANGVTSTATNSANIVHHITHANGVTSATTNGVTNDATRAGTSDITIDDNNDDYSGDTLDELSTRPEADGPFETPRYLRNKRSKRITNATIKGAANTNNSGGTFRAASRGQTVPRKELFISNVAKDVETAHLRRYVEANGFTVNEVQCVSHTDARNKSFRLRVLDAEFVKLFDSEIWPQGVIIKRRFRHSRS